MNDLTLPEGVELTQSKYADDSTFAQMATAASWLPRLQVFGGNSKEVKRGTFPIGHYGLVRKKDQIEDLTPAVDVLVLSWRPKAMSVGDGEVINMFDPSNPKFKEFVERSKEQNSGCFWGPEFLVWIPGASIPCFATFLFGSISARNEAPNMKALIGKAATCKLTLLENKKGMWHSPVIVPCSTPLDMPSMDELRVQLEKFNNPPEKEMEAAPDEAEESRPR